MDRVIISCMLLFTYITVAAGYCYSYFGCQDGENTYGNGDWWNPVSSPCASCYCFATKRYVLRCEEEIVTEPKISVKKSTLYARITEETTVSVETPTQPPHEEVEISQKEAGVKECAPVSRPTFNWETMALEEAEHKIVYYYYMEKVSHCCSTNMAYRNVHPACKVKKTGQCTSEVVLKEDETQPCMYSMSMVG